MYSLDVWCAKCGNDSVVTSKEPANFCAICGSKEITYKGSTPEFDKCLNNEPEKESTMENNSMGKLVVDKMPPEVMVWDSATDFFKTEVKNAPKQGTEDWLNWRKDGITATEAASIMFPDKYNSPLKIYTDKVGLTQHDQSDPDGFFEWGHIIEDDLVRKFSEQHPEITNITQGRLYQDGWKKCSLDAQGWDENGLPVIIECKTSQRMDKWTPFPDRYYAQVQWQMHITGIRRAIIAVLVAEGGWHYFEREIEYSPVFVEKMVEECQKVLECIKTKTPPAQLSNFAPDKEAIAAIAGETGHKGSPQEVDQSLIDRYIELKKNFDEAEEALNQFKNEISYKMIDVSKLTCNGHTFATWVERKGTVSIDKDRLKNEYPDIYQKVLKQGAGSRYIKYNT